MSVVAVRQSGRFTMIVALVPWPPGPQQCGDPLAKFLLKQGGRIRHGAAPDNAVKLRVAGCP